MRYRYIVCIENVYSIFFISDGVSASSLDADKLASIIAEAVEKAEQGAKDENIEASTTTSEDELVKAIKNELVNNEQEGKVIEDLDTPNDATEVTAGTTTLYYVQTQTTIL